MLFSLLIGITVGLLTYLYMQWQQKPKKKQNIKIFVPIIIGVMAWFIAEMLLSECKASQPNMRFMSQKGSLRIPDSDMFMHVYQ